MIPIKNELNILIQVIYFSRVPATSLAIIIKMVIDIALLSSNDKKIILDVYENTIIAPYADLVEDADTHLQHYECSICGASWSITFYQGESSLRCGEWCECGVN